METQLQKLKKVYKTWAVVADQIGITERQLRRYVAGTHRIPPSKQKLIIRLVAEIRS